MSETRLGAFGHVTTRTKPWQRTGSSFIDGDPPHGRPDHGLMPVSTIWADAQHEIPLAFTDQDGCVALILDELSAAWAEAEAALPEGEQIEGLVREGFDWYAYAYNAESERCDGFGHTPAAALCALTEKLRERAG